MEGEARGFKGSDVSPSSAESNTCLATHAHGKGCEAETCAVQGIQWGAVDPALDPEANLLLTSVRPYLSGVVVLSAEFRMEDVGFLLWTGGRRFSCFLRKDLELELPWTRRYGTFSASGS
jgi:hypothetical protein